MERPLLKLHDSRKDTKTRAAVNVGTMLAEVSLPRAARYMVMHNVPLRVTVRVLLGTKVRGEPGRTA